MGDQCLSSAPQRPVAAGRRGGRPVRPRAFAGHRHRVVRRGLDGLRAGAELGPISLKSRGPRHRRRAVDAEQPGDFGHGLFGRGARPGDRHLGFGGCRDGGDRSDARRLADRYGGVARNLSDQSAAGGGSDPFGDFVCPGLPTSGQSAALGCAGRGVGDSGPGPVDLGPDLRIGSYRLDVRRPVAGDRRFDSDAWVPVGGKKQKATAP